MRCSNDPRKVLPTNPRICASILLTQCRNNNFLPLLDTLVLLFLLGKNLGTCPTHSVFSISLLYPVFFLVRDVSWGIKSLLWDGSNLNVIEKTKL